MVSSPHGFLFFRFPSRPTAIAVLMGAAMLAGHTVSAQSAPPNGTPIRLAQLDAPRKAASGQVTEAKSEAAAETKRETVEQRIAKLHTELKITPDEETNWTGVAQAMRDNSAAMEKLVAEKADQNPKSLTAIEDLKTYEQFARAHVDGLKNLRASFETLYNAMPVPQQKIADQVFRSFGQEHAHKHG
jgi:hypothetical protein